MFIRNESWSLRLSVKTNETFHSKRPKWKLNKWSCWLYLWVEQCKSANASKAGISCWQEITENKPYVTSDSFCLDYSPSSVSWFSTSESTAKYPRWAASRRTATPRWASQGGIKRRQQNIQYPIFCNSWSLIWLDWLDCTFVWLLSMYITLSFI